MNAPLAVPLDCWTFCLVDVAPGPSVGDAAEHIESLGFKPWLLEKLELISELARGRVVTAIRGGRVAPKCRRVAGGP
jgi:hypothetical protein